jgi:hypothetical protein
MFQVRPHDARTLSWWYRQQHKIDLKPPYQRSSGVWTRADRQLLIDSILNGYDIPKIYLADFSYGNTPLNRAGRTYAVIDGKQRLEAIFEFFAGKLKLSRRFVLKDEPDLRIGGLGYDQLKVRHPELADRVDQFNLGVMSVITNEEGRIEELFNRLNRSWALTGAEKRNAMRGVVPNLIRSLAEHPFFEDSIDFSTRRGQEKNAVGKMLLIEYRGHLVDTKKTNIDRLVTEVTEASLQAVQEAADKVEDTLDEMAEIFVRKDPLLRSEGPMALYYWFVRNNAQHRKQAVRPYLERIEAERAENRGLRVEEADPVLLDFDVRSRAINDRGSLERLYDILTQRFERFLDHRDEGGSEQAEMHCESAE